MAKDSKEEQPVRISAFVEPHVARAFRAACAIEGVSMSDVAGEMFERYAAERGMTSKSAATPKE